MPRPKPWLGDIPRIIKLLEEQPEISYSRRDVEQIFKIGRSAAAELMRVAGTRPLPGPDGAALVTADNLLHYVRHSPEAERAMAEQTRRKQLAAKLTEASEEQRLRQIPLQVSSADDWCTLKDLPNVAIEHGILRVAFDSPQALLSDLWRFIKAVGNDLDAFERVCKPGPNSADSSTLESSKWTP